MIIMLQLLGFAFALTMVYLALLHYRKNTLSSAELTAWLAIWIAFIIVISFPDIFRTFSSTYLVTRLFDLMVVGGISFFAVIASIAYIRSRKTQNKLENLVRDLAKKQALKNGKGRNSN